MLRVQVLATTMWLRAAILSAELLPIDGNTRIVVPVAPVDTDAQVIAVRLSQQTTLLPVAVVVDIMPAITSLPIERYT
uniref:Putative secreted peptide n=1 Tax=Anopheles braziliensis TaxID=58242 RepID=A0A2M3ZRZ3_9DIPT